ncbi:hypothetical protein JG688_00002001 [Phytophthora aleatoria]|uniref:Uncharacterized protein n=1 Tax=Phytophthora aleatoria TaxID=2496075 RepID=A0A8J5J5B8_9STRA|nr:hypothetical protein JG688_00002001 [Phytophthora aleatoria]
MEEQQDYRDVVYALVTLLAVVFVPTLVRICLVYTFLWNVFTIIAIKMEAFDRSVFDSVLLGWFGFLSKYRVFCVLANTGDFLLHFVCPLVLAAKYLAYVEVWMALPILGSSVLWVYLVADGSLIANHVYHFSPPRPLQFWAVASASMLLSNLTVPLVCVLAHWSGVPDLPIRAVQEAVAMARTRWSVIFDLIVLLRNIMDTAELFSVAHDTLTGTVLRVRDGEQRVADATLLSPDAVQAMALLFAMTLLPVLVRVRILYTFCWVAFTVLAHVIESEAALGMATSLGLTIMMGWYSLRTLDRTTFMGILQGWFGFLSKYWPLRLLANSVDLLLHMGVPLTLAFCYLPLVRVWMTLPILLFSQLWIKLVAGGDLCLFGNDVYHIYPPRPKTFWLAVRKIELIYNFTVPTFCVLAYRAGVHEFVVNCLIKPGL